jgi:hypothetical protein
LHLPKLWAFCALIALAARTDLASEASRSYRGLAWVMLRLKPRADRASAWEVGSDEKSRGDHQAVQA